MRNIKGYIFIVDFENSAFMFGAKTDDGTSDGDYDNFECNGLIPYKTLISARRGLEDFLNKRKRQEIKEKTIAKIRLKIAENTKELSEFKEESDLIVIMKDYDSISKIDKLLGPIVDRKRSFAPIPGGFLKDTDFTTYTHENSKGQRSTYERALYLLSEVNRQAQCPATIAKFNLQRI